MIPLREDRRMYKGNIYFDALNFFVTFAGR